MFNPLIAKLSLAGPLYQTDIDVLTMLVRITRQVQAHQDLTCEGDRPEHVHLILAGFACRYKIQTDGSRNIMAILVPGDFCDLHIAMLDRMDHNIATLTECTLVEIQRTKVLELLEYPRITRALWWASLVDEAILREWLVNLGGRDGDRRIAHLFCELLVRLTSVGAATEGNYPFPLTQSSLADLTGLSNVHVNRVLRDLRERDLVFFEQGHVRIPDVMALKSFSGFDPIYLHLVPRV